MHRARQWYHRIGKFFTWFCSTRLWSKCFPPFRKKWLTVIIMIDHGAKWSSYLDLCSTLLGHVSSDSKASTWSPNNLKSVNMTIQTQPPIPDSSSHVVMCLLGIYMFSRYLYALSTPQADWRRYVINVLTLERHKNLYIEFSKEIFAFWIECHGNLFLFDELAMRRCWIRVWPSTTSAFSVLRNNRKYKSIFHASWNIFSIA